MTFIINRIKLNTWGNPAAVAVGQKRAGHKLGKCKVTCLVCLKRMSPQAFRYHRQAVGPCKNARSEME